MAQDTSNEPFSDPLHRQHSAKSMVSPRVSRIQQRRQLERQLESRAITGDTGKSSVTFSWQDPGYHGIERTILIILTN